jgi:hypothetical protein
MVVEGVEVTGAMEGAEVVGAAVVEGTEGEVVALDAVGCCWPSRRLWLYNPGVREVLDTKEGSAKDGVPVVVAAVTEEREGVVVAVTEVVVVVVVTLGEEGIEDVTVVMVSLTETDTSLSSSASVSDLNKNNQL